ncbi:uncharacterized protein LOC134991325 [Pseudophryne corroboree]|uniref:uncharacterized protein LOC134991325 n=1 Tax=Pseudophryne corroboree TaxID=495146 RepID=UPI0030812B6C
MALTETAKKALWMKETLRELSLLYHSETINIVCDNKGEIDLSSSTKHYGRSKHIAIKHQFIRELVENKSVNVDYIARFSFPTSQQPNSAVINILMLQDNSINFHSAMSPETSAYLPIRGVGTGGARGQLAPPKHREAPIRIEEERRSDVRSGERPHITSSAPCSEHPAPSADPSPVIFRHFFVCYSCRCAASHTAAAAAAAASLQPEELRLLEFCSARCEHPGRQLEGGGDLSARDGCSRSDGGSTEPGAGQRTQKTQKQILAFNPMDKWIRLLPVKRFLFIRCILYLDILEFSCLCATEVSILNEVVCLPLNHREDRR